MASSSSQPVATNARKPDGGWISLAAATLLVFSPLCAFLLANEYPVASAEVGVLLAGCAAVGAVPALAVSFGARAAGAVLLGCLTALSIDFSYHLRGSPAIVLVIVPAACIFLAWILRRHIGSVLLAASFVLLLAIFLIPVRSVDEPAHAKFDTAGIPAGGARLPVILHLILDEHIGIDGLPNELAESAALGSWLTDYYVSRGFRVHTGAYSEYFWTQDSLPNLLNLTSYADRHSHIVPAKPPRQGVLKDSAYFRHLSGLGYHLHVYQFDFLDFCKVAGVAYSSCHTYGGRRIGVVHDTALATTERAEFVLYNFLSTSAYLGAVRNRYEWMRSALPGIPLPQWQRGPVWGVGSIATLPILERLERDLRHATRGNAYFAHLLVPHYPYVFERSCRIRADIGEWLGRTVDPDFIYSNTGEGRTQRYRSYFEQIRCQQTLLDGLFDAMKNADVWRDATVIVHGDHGSRIVRRSPTVENASELTAEDLRDAYSTLFAVRSAGQEGAVLRGPRSLQNLLSDAFNLGLDDASRKVYLQGKGSALKAHEFPGF